MQKQSSCKITFNFQLKTAMLTDFITTNSNYGLYDLLVCIILHARAGLEIMAGQRTMSGLIGDLTGQTFVLPVMLTGQNSIILKMK